MDTRTLLDLFRKIVYEETIWLRHYIGEVKSTTDEDRLGRVCVALYDLGFNDASTGVWAAPRDKNSMSIPAVGDWVEVYFVNGDRNRPVYLGVAGEIAQMAPKSYDGKDSTHVLFEDPEEKITAVFDALKNELNIGKQGFQPCARKEDAVKSTSAEDSAAWAVVQALLGVISGAPIPEPGNGSPSAFQAALAVALSAAGGAPTSLTSKIIEGSDQVKVGNK